MNLLIVTSSFPCSGKSTSGNFVYELAKGLPYDITVLAPHYSGFKLREKMSGISVHRFRYFIDKWEKICYGNGILPSIRENKFLIITLPFLFIFQFINILILGRKADVINAHWILPSGLTSLVASKILRKKFVLTTHGQDVYDLIPKKGIIGSISRYVVNKADKVTVLSDDAHEIIKKYCV